MSKTFRDAHTKALDKLVLDPKIIKINKRDILMCAREPSLYPRRGGPIHPDLVYWMRDGSVVVVEYKSNGNSRLTKKGESQIITALNYFHRRGIPAEGQVVTGDKYPVLRTRKPKKPKIKERLPNRRRPIS
tara:strand:- start:1297 stop:1689 length:393 start_codon:yes stop_codon:yes gene_type:complete